MVSSVPRGKCSDTNFEDGGSNVPLKCWYLPLSSHSITTQKTNADMFSVILKHGKSILCAETMLLKS